MPALVRLYIQSVALGFGIAGAFTAGLLWFDVAGLGHLVMASDIGWVAALMLVVDDLARTLTQAEIPIGIVTALLGAPLFTVLLVQSRRRSTT